MTDEQKLDYLEPPPRPEPVYRKPFEQWILDMKRAGKTTEEINAIVKARHAAKRQKLKAVRRAR